MIKAYDLVALSHETDAPLYRVIAVGINDVSVIEISNRPNQQMQWFNRSIIMQPTNDQLTHFKGR